MNNQRIITEILTQLQQGLSQSRNKPGELYGEEYQRNIQTLKDTHSVKYAEAASKIKTDDELDDAVDEYILKLATQLEKSGMSYTDAFNKASEEGVKFKDVITRQNEEFKKNLDEFETKFKEDIQNYNEKLDKRAYNNVSNGKSGQIDAFGERLDGLGKSMSRLSGKVGGKIGKGLGGFGKSLSSVGGKLTKFAGPIGLAVQAILTLRKVIMGVWDAMNMEKQNFYANKATQMGIETQRVREGNEMKLVAQQANNKMLGSSIQFAKTATQALGALAQDKVAAYGEVGNEGVKIGAEGYSKSHEIAAKAPFDIKGAAYAAANAALELGGQAVMFEKNKTFAEQNVLQSERKTASDISNAQTQFKEDVKLIHTQTQNDLDLRAKKRDVNFDIGTTELGVKRNQQSYEETRAYADAVTVGLAGMVGDFFGWDRFQKSEQIGLEGEAMIKKRNLEREVADAEYNTSRMNAEAERSAMIKKAQSDLANMQIQNEVALTKSKIQVQKTYENTLVESAKKINQAWMDMTQALNDEFLKMEKSSMTMGREIGLTGEQLHIYSQNMGQMQVAISKWGKNLEWMQKQQGAYQENTGRNVQYTEKDFTTSAAVGTLVGDDIVGELNAGMEIFNHSIADSNTQFYEMYKSVSKIGLNGKKYAKDLVKNLSLAEKYNFKNGVKSLMEMSKWAQNMRFNVGSLDGMLDKVQEGGLEGVIKQAAELQVLGGNFAMGSDPMAMAYEAYMDPEAYAKRMNSMIAGQGFLKENGEVGFGIASQQMMRQYAQSTGQDYKDVLNQARAQVKINAIEGNLQDNFSDEQKSLIANKAKFDVESQQWKVTTLDGQEKNVNELTQADMSNLGPEEGEDPSKTMVELQTQMLEKLSTIYSKQESMEIAQTEMKSYLMGDKWVALENTNQSMIDTIRTEFFQNYDKYSKEVDKNLNTLATSTLQFFKMWKKGSDAIDEVRDAVNTAASNINTTISNCWKDGMAYIGKAMSQYAQGAGIDFELPEFKIEDVTKNTTVNSNDPNSGYLKTIRKYMKEYEDTGDTSSRVLANALSKIDPTYSKWGMWHSDETIYNDAKIILERYEKARSDDGVIDNNGRLTKINDGLVIQNGIPTLIDKNDQVLAAKEGGPLDRMLDMVMGSRGDVLPRPIPYDSYVKENPYSSGSGGNDNRIEIPPIQININGSIQLSGGSGNIDITQEIANDPNFIRSLSQMISMEVEKKVRGGRVVNPLNRGLEF